MKGIKIYRMWWFRLCYGLGIVWLSGLIALGGHCTTLAWKLAFLLLLIGSIFKADV